MRVRLQTIRQKQGFTQSSFAEAIGISRNHYGQIETGSRTPSLDVAMRIKAALGYFHDDLFEDIASRKPRRGHPFKASM